MTTYFFLRASASLTLLLRHLDDMELLPAHGEQRGGYPQQHTHKRADLTVHFAKDEPSLQLLLLDRLSAETKYDGSDAKSDCETCTCSCLGC